MVSEKMAKIISEQIKKEYESAYLYFEIANYYETMGLAGFANWFKIQAYEEQDHGIIFYEYLVSNNVSVQFHSINPSGKQFTNFVDPINESLEHEQFITASINIIYDLAEFEKDYRTKDFLSWFIKEQQEEEASFQELLNQFRLFGANAASLFDLDRNFGKREYSPSKRLSCKF